MARRKKSIPDLREMQKALARQSLQAFVLYTTPNYLMGWVHECICWEMDKFLQDVANKKSPRLLLTVPPRHGKSTLASRSFPAYVFGRYPDMSIIATSYSADLSSRMNRDVQRIMDEEKYAELFPGTVLYGKSSRPASGGTYLRNSDIFEIVGHSGVYRSAGVGGGVTGMGADVAIIDDPIRNRADADSPTIRQNTWDWYTSTLYTRLAPGGGVILIQTRWHEDDLAGRLLEAERAGEGDRWKVINFPAIAEQDEYYQGKLVRKAGEALHPERYPLEQLLAIKQAIGSRDWAALYQQHPVPDGGAIFQAEWLRFWLPKDLPARYDTMLTSWDMTFKEGADNDFVVGQVWGRAGANFYLLDQVRGRWGFTETLHQVKQLVAKWPQVRRHLIEDKANGPAVIDMLRNNVPGIIPVEPDGSKVARAHAVTTYFEAGNVLIPHPSLAPWVNDFITELTTFPSAAHDDQCFKAGTKIATSKGDIPIEQIKIDDLVLTPFGFRRVLFAGITGFSCTISKFGISATANHPFVCKDGKIYKFNDVEEHMLSRLTFKEIFKWKFLKLLNSMDGSTPLWAEGNIILANQIQTQAEKSLKDFMSQFGNIITEKKFPKDMIFTIKTAILIIMTLVTLSVYHVQNMQRHTGKTLTKIVNISKKFVTRLMHGIGVKKEEYGIKNTGRKHTKTENGKNMSVNIAKKFIQQGILEKLGFVHTNAMCCGGITTSIKLHKKNANIVENCLNTRRDREEKNDIFVVCRVPQNTVINNLVPVYNLTIEDDHVFYANGVLVHNCDALTQACRDMQAHRTLYIDPSVVRMGAMRKGGIRW